jgi:hypothetical protein
MKTKEIAAWLLVIWISVAGIIAYQNLPNHVGGIFGVVAVIGFFIGRWSKK